MGYIKSIDFICHSIETIIFVTFSIIIIFFATNCSNNKKVPPEKASLSIEDADGNIYTYKKMLDDRLG